MLGFPPVWRLFSGYLVVSLLVVLSGFAFGADEEQTTLSPEALDTVHSVAADCFLHGRDSGHSTFLGRLDCSVMTDTIAGSKKHCPVRGEGCQRVRAIYQEYLSDRSLLAAVALDTAAKRCFLFGSNSKHCSDLTEVAQHDTDPAVRVHAVESYLSDQSVLAAIAETDPDPSVRSAAAEYLTDQPILARIANTDKDATVRRRAAESQGDYNPATGLTKSGAVRVLRLFFATAYHEPFEKDTHGHYIGVPVDMLPTCTTSVPITGKRWHHYFYKDVVSVDKTGYLVKSVQTNVEDVLIEANWTYTTVWWQSHSCKNTPVHINFDDIAKLRDVSRKDSPKDRKDPTSFEEPCASRMMRSGTFFQVRLPPGCVGLQDVGGSTLDSFSLYGPAFYDFTSLNTPFHRIRDDPFGVLPALRTLCHNLAP